MKTRIIVAAIGIPLLLAVIFFLPLWVFAIAAAVISALAAWELVSCVGPDCVLRIKIYPMVSAAVIAFSSAFSAVAAYAAAFVLFFVLFCELMLTFRGEKHMSFMTLTAAFFAGVVIPVLLSALVRLGSEGRGGVFVLLPFVAAFSSDSGAYFAGCFLGKHKLVPHISPNKTIEGSIGGFLATIIIMLIYGLVLKLAGFTVSFLLLGVYGFLGSLAGQLGDLSFSAIKREFGIKDYGNLLPGHGGALDRFDSIVFVAPLIELLMLWVPAFVSGR